MVDVTGRARVALTDPAFKMRVARVWASSPQGSTAADGVDAAAFECHCICETGHY